MEKVKKWFMGIFSEVRRINWPSSNKTLKSAFVATVAMIVSAAVIFGFDSFASMAVRAVLALL